MNTTTNTREVSEAMVAALSKLVEAAVLMLAEIDTCGHEVDPAYRLCLYEAWEQGKAALSAQPAAQGEEGFDVRKYVRHMADVLEAGGDLFKVDADLLRLAAAINKAANTAPPAQPAERVPDGYALVLCEPNEAMLDAASKLQGDDALLDRAKALRAAMAKIYRVMLTASPAPSEGGKGVDRE